MTPSPHPDGVSVSGEEGRVEELRALSDCATPGPWKATVIKLHYPECDDCDLPSILCGPDGKQIADFGERYGENNQCTSEPDSEFTAAAVNYVRDLLASPPPPTMAPTGAGSDLSGPIDMILFCPRCGEQHIDAPEAESWNNPPHRSHLCRACGHIWRPADVPTNGVYAIGTRGKNDSPLPPPPAAGQDLSEAVLDGSTPQSLPTLPDLEGVKEEDVLAAIIAYETARIADGSLGDNLPAMRRALAAALQALEAKNV